MRPASRRTAFATASLTAALSLWTSGAPSVVYPVYGRLWEVPPALTTVVFGVYPKPALDIITPAVQSTIVDSAGGQR